MIAAIDDNLFSPEIIADPYTYFGRLREEDPAHWNKKFGQWIFTRYDDLVWAARHDELFSSELIQRDTGLPYPPVSEEDQESNSYIRSFTSNMFIRQDRPRHTEMRSVVHGSFSPKSIDSWRPLVQSAIQYLLDGYGEKGEMDLMKDFASPLPVLVIAEMMGIPAEDREFIRSSSNKQFLAAREGENRMQKAAEGNREMAEYLDPLIQDRLSNDKGDLLSVVAAGEKNGSYTREEALANASMLLAAGHETTLNLVCNGVLAFIRNPEQWQLFKKNPVEMALKATEECLRYDPPLKGFQRIAQKDVEVRGKLIREGDRTRFVTSSANRDPAVFTNPDKFDITRWPNPHVAFGSGVHHCLGVNLARLEGQEAFKSLAERFPNIQLQTEEIAYQPSIGVRTLESLPVSWG